jgi:prepilin-type processing-associated H-X9-DG protein
VEAGRHVGLGDRLAAEQIEDLHAAIIYALRVTLATAAAAATAAALGLAAPAAATPPRAGVLVPGASLGGLRLGAPITAVVKRWGRSFGVCRGCRTQTWYYSYVPFQPVGTGVSFADGHVTSLFTLWSPPGWRTTKGLTVGDDVTRVTSLYGALERHDCADYYTLALHGRDAVTEFYVVDGRLWGFGLSRAPVRCR